MDWKWHSVCFIVQAMWPCTYVRLILKSTQVMKMQQKAEGKLYNYIADFKKNRVKTAKL